LPAEPVLLIRAKQLYQLKRGLKDQCFPGLRIIDSVLRLLQWMSGQLVHLITGARQGWCWSRNTLTRQMRAGARLWVMGVFQFIDIDPTIPILHVRLEDLTPLA